MDRMVLILMTLNYVEFKSNSLCISTDLLIQGAEEQTTFRRGTTQAVVRVGG